MITLRQPLTFEECQQIRVWRNDPAITPMLRTGAKTYAEQADFYQQVIVGSQADHEFYALEHDHRFVGMGGLTHLQRVPGEAEISLILAPPCRGMGFGAEAVDALLVKARDLGLSVVTGECYREGCVGFWTSQIRQRPATITWRWDLASE